MPRADADVLLIERWRAMTLADRVALIERMCHDVQVMAIAGIRATNPDATEREILHELARRRFGDKLADEAFAQPSR
jgi:hypothetical protein